MIYYIFANLLRPFYWLLKLPMVYGKENFKSIAKGKAMIISNHRSMLDPVRIAFILRRPVNFMGKSDLFKTKIGNWFFRSILVFPVSRKTADIKSIKKAIAVMDEGRVFGIFPEGKRSITEGVDVFEKGAAFLAVNAKTPILPMYIPAHNYGIFKRARLYVGAAIKPEEYAFTGSKSAAITKLTNLLEERIHALRVMAGDC